MRQVGTSRWDYQLGELRCKINAQPARRRVLYSPARGAGKACLRHESSHGLSSDCRGNVSMRFTETALPGAWLIEPEPHRDPRGFFMRTFCEREYAEHGLETRYVQHSTSYNIRAGTVRGMHFQIAPHDEVKVVTCLKGAILDVIIDLRPGSSHYGKWAGFELSDQNRTSLYIPKGFAHGFQTLQDNCEIGYLISEFYTPGASSGWRYNDPAFGITWPLPATEISEKDRAWPDFA
jgi:dTDP-4-dehydrorhamnose 3,5-epimerase